MEFAVLVMPRSRRSSSLQRRQNAGVVGIAGVAEFTFSRTGPTLVIADARSEGFKIIPLCPYVKGQPLRHPEWADVLRG